MVYRNFSKILKTGDLFCIVGTQTVEEPSHVGGKRVRREAWAEYLEEDAMKGSLFGRDIHCGAKLFQKGVKRVAWLTAHNPVLNSCKMTINNCRRHRVLAFEVDVQRTLCQASRLRHVVDGCRVIALGGEHMHGGVENVALHLFLVHDLRHLP